MEQVSKSSSYSETVQGGIFASFTSKGGLFQAAKDLAQYLKENRQPGHDACIEVLDRLTKVGTAWDASMMHGVSMESMLHGSTCIGRSP